MPVRTNENQLPSWHGVSKAARPAMGMAVLFHIDDAGWEGFPLGVVEAHEYGYELAAVYAFVFLYFAVAGPGKFSIGSGDLADAPKE